MASPIVDARRRLNDWIIATSNADADLLTALAHGEIPHAVGCHFHHIDQVPMEFADLVDELLRSAKEEYEHARS